MPRARAFLENPYLYTHLLSITDVSRQYLVEAWRSSTPYIGLVDPRPRVTNPSYEPCRIRFGIAAKRQPSSGSKNIVLLKKRRYTEVGLPRLARERV